MPGDMEDVNGIKDSLHSGKEFIDKVLNSSPVYFVAIDKDGKTILMNDALLTALGYALAEVVGKDYLTTFVPERDRNLLARVFQQIIQTKNTVNENHILTRDGRELLVEWHGCPIVAPGRQFEYFFGVGVDITDKKVIEEELKREQTFFNKAINALKDTLFVFEINTGRPVRWNRAFTDITGYGDEEVSAMKALDDFYDTEDLKKAAVAIVKLLQGETATFEMSLITKNGRRILTEYNSSAIADETGTPKYIITIGRDISERKRIEQELRKKDFIIRSASSAIATTDIDGTMTYANPAFLEKWGFDSLDEVIGRPFSEFWMVEEQLEEIIWILKQGEKKWSGEIKAKKRDGSIFDVYVATAAVMDDRGEAIALMSTSLDISTRIKMEAALHEALAEVQRMKEMIEAENIYLQQEVRMAHLHGNFIGKSNSIKSVIAKAEQVAATDSTVLLLGETGTGKELLARAIHNMSRRKEHPLVVVNCAAIPDTLVESELFGREKGAYTGAGTRKIGRFEIANGSTIFLDEIGELSLDVQAKLMRVLQEGQIERLGGTRTIDVDVRIITATNRDLEKEIKNNKFRPDLYYRLNVFPITIPPLRDRIEDIEGLVRHFVKEMNRRMGKKVEKIPARGIEEFEKYAWPGNVRELHNIIERAMIQTEGNTLSLIPLSHNTAVIPEKDGSLTAMEREYITKILNRTGGRIRGKGGAAEILDVKPTTLEARMSRLGIKRQTVKLQ